MTDKRWSELVDVLPEPMTCGRRREHGMDDPNSPFRNAGKGLDRWERHKSNGDRVCSYCGSLHPEDFLRLVKESAEAPADNLEATRIEPSDKGYKIYVWRPSVKNAHDGGIKFYTPHFESTPTEEQQAQYQEAQRRSNARFASLLKARGLA
jgi:hypothetical protein